MQVDNIYTMDALRFLSTLEDNSIDLIVTSPPYNKGYWSKNRNIHNGPFTKSRHIDYGVFNDVMAPAEYERWQRLILNECIRVIKVTGSIFYNHIDIMYNHSTLFPKYILDYPLKQIIIWNKRNTPRIDKSYFFPITEYVFWIKKNPNARVKFFRKGCKHQKSIWEFGADRNNSHPAPFPLELAENCILACTDLGDIVCDPFMGSGTTALCAKKYNRRYIGCDLNPLYVESAKIRIHQPLDYSLLCL